MSKLWVRLSLSFSLILITGVIAILLLLIIFNRETTIQWILIASFDTPGGPIDRLRAYYRTYEGWENIDQPIEETLRLFGSPSGDAFELTLADADQRIVYDSDPTRIGTILDNNPASNILSITVDDAVVGYLRVRLNEETIRRAIVQNYVVDGLFRTLFIVATVGGIFGISAGIIASRWLTTPLVQLAQTATAIREGQRDRRAAVNGTEEVRVLATAFNTMIDAQQASEHQRQQLVADIAHELRTPLSVLQGNLYAMLEGVYPSDSTHIARLYDHTRLLSRLVNDLHELSQAEARKLPLDKHALNVGENLTEILDIFQPLAENKSVQLKLSLASDLPLIDVDPTRFQQVIHNLLSNALRHTLPQGAITVTARPEGDWVEIRVRDTGGGVSPEHLPYIFERFYRAAPSRDRASGGAGLGLAIARAIVEAHDGTIRASSEGVGTGTEIIVCLPALDANRGVG